MKTLILSISLIVIAAIPAAAQSPAGFKTVETKFWRVLAPERLMLKLQAAPDGVASTCAAFRQTVMRPQPVIPAANLDILRKISPTGEDFQLAWPIDEEKSQSALLQAVANANAYMASAKPGETLPLFNQQLSEISVNLNESIRVSIKGTANSISRRYRDAGLAQLPVTFTTQNKVRYLLITGKDSICDIQANAAEVEFTTRAAASITLDDQLKIEAIYAQVAMAADEALKKSDSPRVRAAALGYRLAVGVLSKNYDTEVASGFVTQIANSFFDEKMNRSGIWSAGINAKPYLEVVGRTQTLINVTVE